MRTFDTNYSYRSLLALADGCPNLHEIVFGKGAVQDYDPHLIVKDLAKRLPHLETLRISFSDPSVIYSSANIERCRHISFPQLKYLTLYAKHADLSDLCGSVPMSGICGLPRWAFEHGKDMPKPDETANHSCPRRCANFLWNSGNIHGLPTNSGHFRDLLR